MNNPDDLPFERKICRNVINRLKDGLPPPFEAIEFLSVGYTSHLEQVKNGLEVAHGGGYRAMLLEGSYGIGKSHFLQLISIIAAQENFVVKHIEVGSGRVFFNNPDSIYRQLLDGDSAPYSRYYWRGDRLRKFVGEIKALAEMYVEGGKNGLVILLDEMENTVHNLYNFRSRAKAYRFMGALFKGRDEGGNGYFLNLENIFIAMATTPGTINTAMHDGGWCITENPAEDWKLPAQINLRPLDMQDAIELAKRIRTIHSCTFSWKAQDYVTDETLEQICKDWSAQYWKNERELVKSVIHLLEITEQNR